VWRVKNIGESSIGAGAEAKVVASEGITLLVKAL
jgi:membrane protein implicated in regulation of membrane protease activity